MEKKIEKLLKTGNIDLVFSLAISQNINNIDISLPNLYDKMTLMCWLDDLPVCDYVKVNAFPEQENSSSWKNIQEELLNICM